MELWVMHRAGPGPRNTQLRWGPLWPHVGGHGLGREGLWHE